MTEIKSLFGHNVARLRESKGLTQAQLGDLLKLGKSGRSYVNQIESGKKGFSPETIEKLTLALECLPFEFFRTEGTSYSSPVLLTTLADEIKSKTDRATTAYLNELAKIDGPFLGLISKLKQVPADKLPVVESLIDQYLEQATEKNSSSDRKPSSDR